MGVSVRSLLVVAVLVVVVPAAIGLGLSLDSGDSETPEPQVKAIDETSSSEASTGGRGRVEEVPGAEGDELPITKMEVEVDLMQLSQLLGRDMIRPVYEPQFISGERAGLPRSDLVIGVEIDGEAKAYPVGPRNYREMVNDVVGGVPILVTW